VAPFFPTFAKIPSFFFCYINGETSQCFNNSISHLSRSKMDDNFSQCSQHIQRMESQSHSEIEENHKKTRKGNYSIEEDMALVRSWLHISEDAVVGRDQKSSKLWQRILDTFHQFLGKVTERNLQGLQNRWQTISHDVSKFCGHYNKIGRLNPSGWNDQLKVRTIKRTYFYLFYLLD